MLYLKYIHHELCTTRIAPDDARYCAARELALEAIKAIERQTEAARRAPRTIWIAGTDEHGDPEPIENDEPWELLEEITGWRRRTRTWSPCWRPRVGSIWSPGICPVATAETRGREPLCRPIA